MTLLDALPTNFVNAVNKMRVASLPPKPKEGIKYWLIEPENGSVALAVEDRRGRGTPRDMLATEHGFQWTCADGLVEHVGTRTYPLDAKVMSLFRHGDGVIVFRLDQDGDIVGNLIAKQSR